MKVFVYGTLKRDYGNNRLLDGQHFLGEAQTDGNFNIIAGGFPVIFPADDGLPLKGEVYDIGDDADVLRRLDQLEAEGSMYFRREIPVSLMGNHDRLVCSAYIGNPQFWARSMDTPMNSRFTNADGVLEWNR